MHVRALRHNIDVINILVQLSFIALSIKTIILIVQVELPTYIYDSLILNSNLFRWVERNVKKYYLIS